MSSSNDYSNDRKHKQSNRSGHVAAGKLVNRQSEGSSKVLESKLMGATRSEAQELVAQVVKLRDLVAPGQPDFAAYQSLPHMSAMSVNMTGPGGVVETSERLILALRDIDNKVLRLSEDDDKLSSSSGSESGRVAPMIPAERRALDVSISNSAKHWQKEALLDRTAAAGLVQRLEVELRSHRTDEAGERELGKVLAVLLDLQAQSAVFVGQVQKVADSITLLRRKLKDTTAPARDANETKDMGFYIDATTLVLAILRTLEPLIMLVPWLTARRAREYAKVLVAQVVQSDMVANKVLQRAAARLAQDTDRSAAKDEHRANIIQIVTMVQTTVNALLGAAGAVSAQGINKLVTARSLAHLTGRQARRYGRTGHAF